MADRLLYLLNVSNPDRLSSDSGLIVAGLLTAELAELGWDVAVVGPAWSGDSRVRFVRAKPPATKYHARFSFNLEGMAQVFRGEQPTAVVVNQLEVAAAVRAALLDARVPAKILGYGHYIPFYYEPDGSLCADPSLDDSGLGDSIRLQFFAGLHACDQVMVHSRCAVDWITRAATAMGVSVDDKLHAVPPPRDPQLVSHTSMTTPLQARNAAVAVYNHRLYEHYGTSQFVELATKLVEGLDLQLTVMDVFGERRRERVSLDASPERYARELAALPGVRVVSDGGDRAAYRGHLARARFGIAPFRPGCTWSMSVIDCHAMGVPVMAPPLGWLADAVHPDLQFGTADTALRIAHSLITDDAFWRHHSGLVRQSTADLDPDRIAKAYVELIR